MTAVSKQTLWRVATAELRLGKSVIEFPDKAWIDLPLSNDRIINLTPGKDFTVETEMVVTLPDKIEVILSTPALLQALPRKSGDRTIRLPEGARVHFPQGHNVVLHLTDTKLPPGTKIIWPAPDEERSVPKLNPVVPRHTPAPLFWLPQGAGIALREGGVIWFEEVHAG
jgi:hypothetical protein